VGGAPAGGRAADRLGFHLTAVAVVLGTLAAGAVLRIGGYDRLADVVWATGVTLVLVPLAVDVGRSLLRGDVGVDAVALLAMAGALATRELLAGAVIAVMLAGGNALESIASRRARSELTRLLERAPTVAHRRIDGTVSEVAIDAVAAGDVLVVRHGEVVPVDGVVSAGAAVVDESALTGEPLPVTRRAGDEVRSGTSNAGGPFDLRATRRASESAYAAIVRLVQEAETQQAPFVRLADRYALGFLGLTVALAGGAWLWSGDPVRAVAVLVVATPCPLILAAPIAFVSGLSRATRRAIVARCSRITSSSRRTARATARTPAASPRSSRVSAAAASPSCPSCSSHRRSSTSSTARSSMTSSRRRRPG